MLFFEIIKNFEGKERKFIRTDVSCLKSGVKMKCCFVKKINSSIFGWNIDEFMYKVCRKERIVRKNHYKERGEKRK
jgi:hypothetical protein